MDHRAWLCYCVFMRTTIDIPDPLFRRVKTKAAMDGTSLKRLITRFIEQGLDDRSREPTHDRRGRSPLPLIRLATGRPIPALSNAELDALLGREEAESIGRG